MLLLIVTVLLFYLSTIRGAYQKGQTACDSLSAQGSRYTDTSDNDNTYGLRLSLHMRKVYKGR